MSQDAKSEARRTLDERRAAAERAEAATLWEDAAREYEACLSLMAGGEDGEAEAGLLTALGRCYWYDGQARPAWRTLRRAIGLCRERGDGVGMAAATWEILRIWGPPDRQRAMADEALEALGDADPHLRALLLLGSRRMEEAIAIGEAHQFPDLLTARTQEVAWKALDEGRAEEYLRLLRQVYETSVGLGRHDMASGQLRGMGFAMMEIGRLGDGMALAEESLAYADRTHLRFQAQLALMDLVGAAFARCEFERCEELLARTPGEVDFRADLYRMWMALHRGEIGEGMRLLVEPERGGRTPTAVSQIHAAAAGMLFAAGQEEAARRELLAWAEVSRQWESFAEEAAAPGDCLVALADDRLAAEVRDAFAERDRARKLPIRYSTLQGRGVDEVRGALALRLGLLDEAGAYFGAGVEWAEREECSVDAGRCVAGLGRVALRRERRDEAREEFGRAAARFEGCGAVYELRRVRREMEDMGGPAGGAGG
ncbi:MAG: hypothetical protein WEC75_11645 [Dehalococcoidia bacterium]